MDKEDKSKNNDHGETKTKNRENSTVVIDLFINDRNENDKLIDVSKKLEKVIISGKYKYIFKMLKSPFNLYEYSRILPDKFSKLGGRAFLVNNKFVWKHDEQLKANSLSFITNLFAKACKINCPDMIITDMKYNLDDPSEYDNEKELVQLIEYIPEWKDYSSEHPRSDKFVKQLSRLLAFDLVVANTDRFLFITRYIDNIIFSSYPGYEQMDLWLDPHINEGNFGFVGTDLWSIDHRAYDNLDYISKLHSLLNDDFIKECTKMMTTFFKLNKKEEIHFFNKVKKYIQYNLSIYPKFELLYNWIFSY